jgi:DNA repair exonuclease SbcCD ATPase subunit
MTPEEYKRHMEDIAKNIESLQKFFEEMVKPLPTKLAEVSDVVEALQKQLEELQKRPQAATSDELKDLQEKVEKLSIPSDISGEFETHREEVTKRLDTLEKKEPAGVFERKGHVILAGAVAVAAVLLVLVLLALWRPWAPSTETKEVAVEAPTTTATVNQVLARLKALEEGRVVSEKMVAELQAQLGAVRKTSSTAVGTVTTPAPSKTLAASSEVHQLRLDFDAQLVETQKGFDSDIAELEKRLAQAEQRIKALENAPPPKIIIERSPQ